MDERAAATTPGPPPGTPGGSGRTVPAGGWRELALPAALVTLSLCPSLLWLLQTSSAGPRWAALVALAVWTFLLALGLRAAGLAYGPAIAGTAFALFIVAAPLAVIVLADLPGGSAVALGAAALVLPVVTVLTVLAVRLFATPAGATVAAGVAVFVALLVAVGLAALAVEARAGAEEDHEWEERLAATGLEAYLPEIDGVRASLESVSDDDPSYDLAFEGAAFRVAVLTPGHSSCFSSEPSADCRAVEGGGMRDILTRNVEVLRGTSVLVLSYGPSGEEPGPEEVVAALNAAEPTSWERVVDTRE